MHSALTTADLTDGVHPTAGGYDKMAAVWYTRAAVGARQHRPVRHPQPAPRRPRPPVRSWRRARAGAWTSPASTQTNGTQVQIWDCNGQANQQWTSTGAGELRVYGGKCLDASAQGTAAGTKVQIWDCNGGPTSSGTSTPTAPSPRVGANKCLDVPNHSTANGVKLQVWTCTGAAQPALDPRLTHDPSPGRPQPAASARAGPVRPGAGVSPKPRCRAGSARLRRVRAPEDSSGRGGWGGAPRRLWLPGGRTRTGTSAMGATAPVTGIGGCPAARPPPHISCTTKGASVKHRLRALFAAVSLPLVIAGMFLVARPAAAATLTRVTNFGNNPTNLNMYIYVPDNVARTAGAAGPGALLRRLGRAASSTATGTTTSPPPTGTATSSCCPRPPAAATASTCPPRPRSGATAAATPPASCRWSPTPASTTTSTRPASWSPASPPAP